MSTPGKLPITVYNGASHDLVIQFKDSDGNDFDISSYTDFLMRIYKVSNRSQIGEDIELTRTGSQLDHTFSVEDIQGYPSNMRHEILFKNGADVDPVLRGNLIVTDVLKDDTVSTSAEVTLTDDVTVVTVSDVTIVNELGSISSQTAKTTPDDTDVFVGQESDNSLFKVTWANIVGYFSDLAQTLTNKTLTALSNTIYADQVHVTADNETGSTIVKGRAVYASGYNVGQDEVEITLADASDDTKMPAIGITFEEIESGSTGAVAREGIIEGLDTSSYSVGDVLYVSETAGELTATKPSASGSDVQPIAIVTRSNAGNGVIQVIAVDAYKITPTADGDIASKKYADDVSLDTTITDGADNDLLTLESGVWVNKTREEVGKGKEMYSKSAIGAIHDLKHVLAWDSFSGDNQDIPGRTLPSSQVWQSKESGGSPADYHRIVSNFVRANSDSTDTWSWINLQDEAGDARSRDSKSAGGYVASNNASSTKIGYFVGAGIDNCAIASLSRERIFVDIIVGGASTNIDEVPKIGNAWFNLEDIEIQLKIDRLSETVEAYVISSDNDITNRYSLPSLYSALSSNDSINTAGLYSNVVNANRAYYSTFYCKRLGGHP